jgi:uncharacterized membrane protein
MIKIEQQVAIDRPVTDVFDYVQDYANHQSFSTAFKETRQLSEGSFGVGTRVLKISHFLGKEVAVEQQVISFEPNHLICLKTISGPIAVNEQLVFEEKENKTLLTVSIVSEPPRIFALALPFLKAKVQNQLKEDLLRLKRMLESVSP